jgi:hypothetical protein
MTGIDGIGYEWALVESGEVSTVIVAAIRSDFKYLMDICDKTDSRNSM